MRAVFTVEEVLQLTPAPAIATIALYSISLSASVVASHLACRAGSVALIILPHADKADTL